MRSGQLPKSPASSSFYDVSPHICIVLSDAKVLFDSIDPKRNYAAARALKDRRCHTTKSHLTGGRERGDQRIVEGRDLPHAGVLDEDAQA